MAEILSFTDAPRPATPPDADTDTEDRRRALDIRGSFVVEAPAGSGKTALLIQRYLKLLADDSVEQPEQVLAMTFTIKATAELRDRVLAHLSAAAQSTACAAHPGQPTILTQLAADSEADQTADSADFESLTRNLALAVLDRDRQFGWDLIDHPHRLYIRTIGSVCADIAGHLPILSGSGGRLFPTTDPAPLYREAARRTLLLLGTGDATFDPALRDLLLHRDGNLADCESLIANMLSLRDQWARLVPLTPSELDDKSLDSTVRPRLELALDHVIRAGLARLAQAFPADQLAELTDLAADLAPAAPYDPEIPSPIALCAGLRTPPEPLSAHLDHWLALIHLLTTADGGWRKERGLTGRNLKFEYDRKHPRHTHQVAILDRLRGRDDLLAAFANLRALPPAHYPGDQWAVAKSLFRVLSRALVELQLVFAEQGQCDFTEPTLLARAALTADSGPEDLASALGARLQHLLVDEMQDTSTSQYDLIQLLTASWDGHSQTVFLVGDPRQSIYLFRQAHVERFIATLEAERLGELPLARLRLTANFRSQSTLVEQFNRDFSLIFTTHPNQDNPPANTGSLDIPYAPAHATRDRSSYAQAVVWHTHPLDSASATASAVPSVTLAQGRQRQHQQDATAIRAIVEQWLEKPLPEGRRRLSGGQPEPWMIAILVRNRAHLDPIVAEFKSTGTSGRGTIPFRAIEIDSLSQCQEVLDLTALTRALLHPADRVATLAVLRAPWCGLSLADLHTLTGADNPAFKEHSVARLMLERGHLLPNDSCKRMARVWNVLQSGANQRARLSTAQRVERAWRSLGGDAWLTPLELNNSGRFLRLLDEIEAPGGRIDPVLLERHLHKLFAEPSPVPENSSFVDLLTIHKAKGLEWDVVIVPALEGKPGGDRSSLLTWAEIDLDATGGLPDGRSAHIMLAPISGKGEDSHALTRWLKNLHRGREAAERKRLFYVACTRAREELHLFAAPKLTSNGEVSPPSDSLLNAAWPAAESHFAATPLPQDSAEPVAEVAPFNLALAASAAPSHPTIERLPLAFDPAARFADARADKLPYGGSDSATGQAQFSRPEGSFAARSFGNVVHAALESLANRIADGCAPTALLADLPTWGPRLAALLRADGLPPTTVNRLAQEARAALENTLRDSDGLWLLAPNACASSELALTAAPMPGDPVSVHPISIRIDRIFRAGPEPHAPGEDILWIIDYKTSAHGSSGMDGFLAAQRAAYAPQLETYARILTRLPYPPDRPAPREVRLALYYPTLPRLHWWPLA